MCNVVKNFNFRRGQIYLADLSGAKGSEQGGTRPVMIIQNDIGNKYSPTVIVAPITSQIQKHKLPTQALISEEAGLNNESMIMLEQVRTIDKTRLMQYIGMVDEKEMSYIDKAGMISLGFTKKPTLDKETLRGLNERLNKVYDMEVTIYNLQEKGMNEILSIFLHDRETGLAELQRYCKENKIDYKEYYKPYNPNNQKNIVA